MVYQRAYIFILTVSEIFLLLCFLDAKSSGGGVLGSHSSEFYIAFGRNSYTGIQDVNLTLHITSIEPGPVLVTDTTFHRQFNVFATINETLVVEIPSNYQVSSNSESERKKGIHIKAHNNSSIRVYGMNYAKLSSDAFLALPCHYLPLDRYEYFGISYGQSNYFIIVGSSDNTTIKIGSNTHVMLNKMETYLIESTIETPIYSNKPIAVFVGSTCSNISREKGFCDHLYEQLPPSYFWGKNFLTASFEGRKSREIYRIVASQNSTSVNVNCTHLSNTETFTLSEPGSYKEINNSAPNQTTAAFSKTYCSINSNKPILVMQFSQAYEFDEIGDPSMMMIAPVEQYLTKYSFTAFPHLSTNHITIYTNSENFDPQNIFIDGNSLENSTWTTVYCSSSDEICGYITYANLTTGYHTLYHSGCSSQVGMSAYGFDYHYAYAYPGGLKFSDVESEPIAF